MTGSSRPAGLPVPVVWSEDCLRHDPAGEVWLGVREPGTEVPARALALRDALATAGAPVVARPHGEQALHAVHDPLLIDHLAGVWRAGRRPGSGDGRDRVVPYVFPTPGMLSGLRSARLPPCTDGPGGSAMTR